MSYRRRRLFVVFIIALVPVFIALNNYLQPAPPSENVQLPKEIKTTKAIDALNTLDIKGRAPKTGYSRSQFGDGWASIGTCDTRNPILKRDLKDTIIDKDDCKVIRGTLDDPYSGLEIIFVRGQSTSQTVQIDHVVALSDAWQKGAQQLEYETRVKLANDSLELLAVDGPLNQKKGDSDAASWLPPNKIYRCAYIARQIAVKQKYSLWVTLAESQAMKRVLAVCPNQVLPIEKKSMNDT